MNDYKPSSIVVSLCKKLRAIPIAESDRLKTDGVLVIVVEDGRKLTFSKDDITRTLTEPEIVGAQHDAPAAPDGAMQAESKPAKTRKKKEQTNVE